VVLEAEIRRLRNRNDEKYEDIPPEVLVRFWEKVDKAGPDGCWVWLAQSERFHTSKAIAITPRRLTYRLAFGEMPEEQQIRMVCHNVKCVNPEHVARTDEQKFWALVDKGDGTGCWIWKGGLAKRNYGMFCPRTGEITPAHRYAYELVNGPIGSSDLFACHKCDNPPCVRPDHIFIGTAADNHADMVAKGRHPIIAKGRARKAAS
jgi:hypothetical protein